MSVDRSPWQGRWLGNVVSPVEAHAHALGGFEVGEPSGAEALVSTAAGSVEKIQLPRWRRCRGGDAARRVDVVEAGWSCSANRSRVCYSSPGVVGGSCDHGNAGIGFGRPVSLDPAWNALSWIHLGGAVLTVREAT